MCVARLDVDQSPLAAFVLTGRVAVVGISVAAWLTGQSVESLEAVFYPPRDSERRRRDGVSSHLHMMTGIPTTT